MPYFDRTYFDSSYFATDSAAAIIPPLGGRYLEPPDQPDQPAPADIHEDEDFLFL